MAIRKPFNFKKWIDDNRHLLKPPVGNKQVYIDNEDFIVMVVGGPNGRKDYHWEVGEELFLQIEGDIVVKIINENGQPEDVHIKEGEMYLLPPRIPHSPQRPADSIGLVLERHRREGEYDKLMWFCENCNNKLHEETFALEDIVTQLKAAISEYSADEEKRTCNECGTVMQMDA